MLSRLKHQINAALGRNQTVPSIPPVDGVAGAEWYDSAYRAIDNYAAPYWESYYYFLWTVLADRIKLSNSRRVIDIGCGPGQFAQCLFDIASIEAYAGLDFSSQAIAMAKRACPQGHFVVGDATTTSIHDEFPHELVTCTEVLEHVPDDHAVIDRFRAGVRCLCTVPNFPYQSHVRHFESESQVLDRYGAFFDEPKVWALRATRENIFYLLDGVRNNHRR
jgi:SAM-dependent methyltransferase